jgi:Fe-S-cluster containining protein
MPPPLPSHERLLARVDNWFHRTRASLLGELPCGRGCFRCCIGMFPITALDADALSRGLTSLAPELRRDIQATARSQAALIEASFPRLRESAALSAWSDAEVDRIVEQFTDLPCPALGSEGECRVYPFRPVTCRMMGIPVEENGLLCGACEVQTAVPIVRVPRALREEEDRFPAAEAGALDAGAAASGGRDQRDGGGEVLLPYGFVQPF